MAGGKPKGGQRPTPKRANNAKRASGSKPAPSGARRPAAQLSRRDKERRALRNRLIAGLVLLVVLGAVVFSAARPEDSDTAVGPLDEGAGDCTLDSKSDDIGPGGVHIPNPTYEVEPPAGGSHLPTAAQPGFYEEGAGVPPDGQLVHAMEHGFVVLWYRPDLAPEKLDQLEALSDRLGRELIVVPRPSLDGDVAVTAWHKRLRCAELVPEKVAEFSRKYRDKGPEKGFL